MPNKNRLLLILLIMLGLAGCAGKQDAEPAAAVQPTAAAPTSIPSAAEAIEGTAAPAPVPDTPTDAPPTLVPIPPTDTPPATEIPAATASVAAVAKPQFLEFYTEW